MASRIATDDAARRQEFIWLGPVDMPWPFEARGSAWLWALIVLPIMWVVTYLLTPAFLIERVTQAPEPVVVLLKIALSLLVGSGLGVLLVTVVGRRIGPSTPLRHHASMLMHEVSSPRPDAPEVTYRVSVAPEVDMERSPSHRTTHRISVPEGLSAALDVDEE